MTNGDWLRSKGDNELAEFIAECEAVRRVEIFMHGAKGEIIVKEDIKKWLAEEYEDAQDDDC